MNPRYAALITAVLLLAGCVPAATPDEPAGTAVAAIDETKAAKPKAKPKKTEPAEPAATVAQQQAIRSAKSYLNLSGFSRYGLIQQLTSKAGEGFKQADAEYAVNHIKVDWNAEAVESAKSYMSLSGFSRAGLIEQLHSKAGSGFTLKQAEYAADKVGL